MTEDEARALKPGIKVYFGNNENDTGIVEQIGYTGFSVKWEDGYIGWIDFKDAEDVHIF